MMMYLCIPSPTLVMVSARDLLELERHDSLTRAGRKQGFLRLLAMGLSLPAATGVGRGWLVGPSSWC
jgi:hypothetical protein